MQTHILIRDGGWCTRRRQRQRLYTCFIHLSCRSCLQFYVGEGLGSHFYSFMSTAISESLIAFLQLSLADCRSSLCSQKHIYCAFAVLVIQPNEMVFFLQTGQTPAKMREVTRHTYTLTNTQNCVRISLTRRRVDACLCMSGYGGDLIMAIVSCSREDIAGERAWEINKWCTCSNDKLHKVNTWRFGWQSWTTE